MFSDQWFNLPSLFTVTCGGHPKRMGDWVIRPSHRIHRVVWKHVGMACLWWLDFFGRCGKRLISISFSNLNGRFIYTKEEDDDDHWPPRQFKVFYFKQSVNILTCYIGATMIGLEFSYRCFLPIWHRVATFHFSFLWNQSNLAFQIRKKKKQYFPGQFLHAEFG